MSATGFNPGSYGDFSAAATRQSNLMQQQGEEVKTLFSKLTTDGLQGDSAGASQQMSDGVNSVTNAAKQTVAQLNARAGEFGQNMGNTDRSFASQIFG